jgi:hypothetical protein
MRRVVCGPDADGRSAIVSDTNAASVERAGGTILTDLWRVEALPAHHGDDDSIGEIGVAPPLGGAVVRMCTFPPDSEIDMEAFDAAMREIYGPQQPVGPSGAAHGMHRTETVDVVTLLSGELYAVLETAETLLHPGDSLIQRGTVHAWSNRSNRPATVISVMMGAIP